jgi:hypothetical protein
MKLALSFLGGAIFSAATVVLAGGRPANMLFLGAALALASLAALVYLAGLRRVARFLNAFVDAVEVKPARGNAGKRGETRGNTGTRPVIDRSNPMGYVKPSKKQQEQILQDTAAEYLGDDADLFGTAGRVQ